MGEMLQVFAEDKVAVDADRTARWLAGESVFPNTIELDLTDSCTRACPACPFGASRLNTRYLSLRFLDRLFSILDGQTPGMILSGGEPTLSPHFPEVLALARRRGFRQIATISNGTRLHLPAIQDALLEHGTALRVSLYDWESGRLETARKTFAQVAHLRERADREGSRLEIGVSMLTSRKRLPYIGPVADLAAESGAHWLYFHPFCRDWEVRPAQDDQTGVLEALDDVRDRLAGRIEVQVARDRYGDKALHFSSFHAAHFLLQIGADGVNYIAPEAKYRPESALVALDEDMDKDFLWHPDRLARIAALDSGRYPVIGTRHRGSIFSDHLERRMAERGASRGAAGASTRFRYPDII